MLREGGGAVLLENVADQDPYVFARDIENWSRLFEDSGLTVVATRPYDYGPLLRLLRRGALWRRARRNGTLPTPETHHTPVFGPEPSSAQRAVIGIHRAAQRAGVAIDGRLEPMLLRMQPRAFAPTHCGFLLRAC